MLVTYGDVPLLSAETLHELLEAHPAERQRRDGAHHRRCPTRPATAGSCATPTARCAGIVEQKDATDEQRAITEINSGIYAFDADRAARGAGQVGTDNAQGEKYLTDVLAIARTEGAAGAARTLIEDLVADRGRQRPGAAGPAAAPS